MKKRPSSQDSARDATASCMCHRNGSSAKAATRSWRCSRPVRSALWRSTRPTASANGDTTSDQSIVSSDACGNVYPASACTPIRQPPPRGSGAISPPRLPCTIHWSSSARFDRPNLLYRVLPRAALKQQLLGVLERHRREPGIIYCVSRREVDTLAEWLTGLGTPALPYHAGLSDEDRRHNQDEFLNERVDVIVATVAFGMGIDRSNVRFVVHAGAPRSLEHYQQESGRAGRDGLEAECVLISSAADFMKWRLMLERSAERSPANDTLLRQMERYATGVGCRHRHLAEYFGDEYPADRTGDQHGCAACDYCLDELETVADPTALARKILSCVARVEQRFGATHVANILRGHTSEQVVARGHERLSTFGLLPDASVTEVRGYIEQLTGLGLLRHAGSEYPVLALTSAGLECLKDETRCSDLKLARQRPPRKAATRARSRAEAPIVGGRRS